MSNTSSSLRSAPPQSHVSGSSSETMIFPQPSASQYQAGMRCPHQSWREMFQSRISVSHFSYTLPQRSGMNRTLPSRCAFSAGSARPFMSTNHWSERRGSTTVPQR